MGFPGRDILIVRGEPNNMLFTKLEKPVFFLNAMATFALPSSEYRFELVVPFSPGTAARVGEVSISEPPGKKVVV
jgi:hypothetical protein